MPIQSNKLDFSGQSVFIGFDTHLKNWKVSVMVNDVHHRTFSQDPSPELLANYLRRNFPSASYHAAYEAGFCGFWIHQELNRLGVNCMVVNPADVPTTGKEATQKEDARDSLKIVKALRAGLLKPIYVPSPQSIEERGLLRMRAMAAKDLARAKNRLKSHLYFLGITIPSHYQKQSKSWSRSFIKWLTELPVSPQCRQTIDFYVQQGKQSQELKKNVTTQLQKIGKASKHQKNCTLLQSVPGVGFVTAITLLLEIDDINRFASIEHFHSFIGLVPSTRSSGEKERVGGITPRRSCILRKTLIESAWIAVRRDPALMQKFVALRKRMNANRAIVRIAKKLAGRILTVLKNQEVYKLSHIH